MCSQFLRKTVSSVMSKRKLEPEMKTDDYMDNDPIHVNGVENLVTWFIHSGKTQISIARCNIRQAQFGICIIPVDSSLLGNDHSSSGIRTSYRHLMPQNDKNHVAFGEVVWCGPNHRLNCGHAALAVIIEQNSNTGQNQQCINNLVQNIIGKAEKLKFDTIGIQLSKMFDVSMLVRSFAEHRNDHHGEQMSMFICTNENTVVDIHTVKNIDQIAQKMKLPRRLAQPEMHDMLPSLKIRTQINQGLLLDSGCEAVVAAVGQDLNLKHGGIIRDIAAKAGEDCQNYLHQKNDVVEYWKVMMCPPGQLTSDGIHCLLFGCLPKWKEESDSVKIPKSLARFIFGCLLLAEEAGCSSLAIPLLGTGQLKYPERIVFDAILDGIELYARLTTLGKITKVVIAFPNLDEDSNKLYSTELHRRGNSEMKAMFKNANVELLVSTNTRNKYTVVKKQDLQDQLPVKYVDVVLSSVQDTQSRAHPQMIGGKLIVRGDIHQNNLEEVIKIVIDTCESERITHIVVHTGIQKITTVTLVESFVKASDKPKSRLYLHMIVIAVGTVHDFTACKSHFTKVNKKKLENIGSLNTVNVGPIWKLKSHVSIDNAVYIIGDNENLMKRDDKNDIVAQEESINEHSSFPNDVVSAEINPGIIQYLRRNEAIDIWISRMKKSFNLNMIYKNDNAILQGSLADILKAERYFETDFPNRPKENIPTQGQTVQPRTPVAISTTATANDHTKSKVTKPMQLVEKNKNSFEETQTHPPTSYSKENGKEFVGNVKDGDNPNVNQVSASGSNATEHAKSPMLVNKTTPKGTGMGKGSPYTFRKFCVYVYQGDITTVPVNVIVCADDPSFNHKHSLAKYILSEAGGHCLNDWTQLVLAEGRLLPLKDNSCYVTHAGNLKFNKMIHVIRPSKLEHIHKAFSNILYKTEALKSSSVVIPTIGAGFWKGRVKDCAEQYHQAIRGYCDAGGAKDERLKEVHIVATDPETIKSVRAVFDKNTREALNQDDLTLYQKDIFSSSIIVTKQDILSITTDVTVLPSTSHFTEESDILKKALQRCQALNTYFQNQKEDILKGFRYYRIIYGGLYCKAVILSAWPQPVQGNETLKRHFQDDVQATMKGILKCTMRVNDVADPQMAIPLLTISDDRQVNKVCCQVIVDELIQFLQTSEQTWTIYVAADQTNFTLFRSVLNHRLTGETTV